MSNSKPTQKGWDKMAEENKKLIRSVFRRMGGNISKLTIHKIEYAMEVKHQDFKESVIINRKHFDDKNIQAIEKLLEGFLKSLQINMPC